MVISPTVIHYIALLLLTLLPITTRNSIERMLAAVQAVNLFLFKLQAFFYNIL